MIRYNGINHLAMVTADMDATIRFWRDLLGMRLVAGLGGPGYRHYFLQVSDRDLIAFFEWTGAEPVPEKEHGRAVRGPITFDHVSFGVETPGDLWAIKERLDAAGFWVSEVVDHGFIHSIYSFDPNGIPIEFSWNVEDVDIRRSPVMADRAPSHVAKEGPEPRDEVWPQVKDPTPVDQRRIYPGAGRDLIKGKA